MNVLDTFRLSGYRALVTGASQGIGRATALALAQAGAHVGLTARNEQALTEVSTRVSELGGEAAVIPADLRQSDSARDVVEEAVSSLGGLDLLVHNAGGPQTDAEGRMILRPLTETSDQDWQEVIDINLMAAVRLCRAAHPALRSSERASVLLVSSVAALVAVPGMESYGAVKNGLLSYVRSLAVAWAPDGIRVNALCPGWVRTQLTEPIHGESATSQAALTNVPMRRWGTPEDVVGPAVFLSSPAASFVTGQHLTPDGGLTAFPAMPGSGAEEGNHHA
ncbi:NAD(P)-dependent dehydrogenase (short-subunit alcohol dehydrogenase family) [Haloactinospora alba]|uniref:NAD(P)-dependent dehydrogenase (Short-subunit alcohol dehydrogenase family) n=1 Tax=Haloactinospora alba TaxID=405555 RepID=A0A543NKV2_9ACTN|nr:SDR family oxidoreductase [Haloactinospora alba]TQN32505.1 NAD(P)-dependent dehydrogenase (short-subunit alcohol dehydrogenase family) [Haloactinospora alba]